MGETTWKPKLAISAAPLWIADALAARREAQLHLLSMPPGTLTANLIGGYIIGFAIAYFAQAPNLVPEWRLFSPEADSGSQSRKTLADPEETFTVSAVQRQVPEQSTRTEWRLTEYCSAFPAARRIPDQTFVGRANGAEAAAGNARSDVVA